MRLHSYVVGVLAALIVLHSAIRVLRRRRFAAAENRAEAPLAEAATTVQQTVRAAFEESGTVVSGAPEQAAVPVEDEWVTFHRIWHPGLCRWLLVQKSDGCTRTIVERFPVHHSAG